jgi:ABC-type uncharacterized transport system permease subunit
MPGGDLWTGVAVRDDRGDVLWLLHGFLTVPLGLSQHVVGLGITLLATSSLTYFTYRAAAGGDIAAAIEPFQPLQSRCCRTSR